LRKVPKVEAEGQQQELSPGDREVMAILLAANNRLE